MQGAGRASLFGFLEVSREGFAMHHAMFPEDVDDSAFSSGATSWLLSDASMQSLVVVSTILGTLAILGALMWWRSEPKRPGVVSHDDVRVACALARSRQGDIAFDEGSGCADVDPRRRYGTVFARRTRKDWSPDVSRAVALASLQPGVVPVGSFSYRAHAFPSDIDLSESYVRCCTLEKLRTDFVSDLQRVVRRVQTTPGVFLGDFKAGYDSRFDLYLGERGYNAASGPYIKGFNALVLSANLHSLRAQRVLTRREADEGLRLVKQCAASAAASSSGRPSLESFDALARWVRAYRVLRWSSQEILEGKKRVANNNTILLVDAIITGKSIVKLDLWVPVDGRYIEVSNWFALDEEVSAGGARERVSGSLGEYESALSADIRAAGADGHWLKASKRAWSLAISVGDLATAAALAPLFSSLAAVLNQIATDMRVASAMIDKLGDRAPTSALVAQLRVLRSRLANFASVSRLSPESGEFVDLVDKKLQLAGAEGHASNATLEMHMARLTEEISTYVDNCARVFLRELPLDVLAWVESIHARGPAMDSTAVVDDPSDS